MEGGENFLIKREETRKGTSGEVLSTNRACLRQDGASENRKDRRGGRRAVHSCLPERDPTRNKVYTSRPDGTEKIMYNYEKRGTEYSCPSKLVKNKTYKKNTTVSFSTELQTWSKAFLVEPSMRRFSSFTNTCPLCSKRL